MNRITLLILLAAAGCASEPHSPEQAAAQIAQTISEIDRFESIAREPNSTIADSLPELRYLRTPNWGASTGRIELNSVEGDRFTIHLLRRPDEYWPSDSFTLAYLADAQGNIVDWKSQWLHCRQGALEDRALDLNGDGVLDLCFLAKGAHRWPDRFLAAYCVMDGRFFPVIEETAEWFELEFKPATVDGLVIELIGMPQWRWQTQKIHRFPVKITNRSPHKIDLRGRAVGLNGNGLYGGGQYEPLPKDAIEPGESIESFVDYYISSVPGSRTVSFVLVK